jgi:hypothetical protein
MNGRRAKTLRRYCGYNESQNKWTRRLYRALKKEWSRLPAPAKQLAAKNLT